MKQLSRITTPILGKIHVVGLLIGCIALLASCQNDEGELIPEPGTPRNVTITVSANQEMRTRAISQDEDNDITRCLIQVGTEGTPAEMTPDADGTTFTYSTTLTVGQSVTFLFWADDESYTATDLTDIQTGNNGPGIAYAASTDWDGTSETIDAELTLAVSKVTLLTTTDIPAGNTVSVRLSDTYKGYNVATGAYTGNAAPKTYTHRVATAVTGASKTAPKEVFSFYTLTDQTQDITLTYGSLSTTLTNISIAPGQQLILTGDMSSQADMNLDITASIEDTWEQVDITFERDKLTDATQASTSLIGSGTPDAPYLIRSAADLLRYNESSTYRNGYTRLETDIEVTTSSWTPLKALGSNGTFDGNGHTISGTLTCTVNDPNNYVGLFGEGTGTIRDLNVTADIHAEGSIHDMITMIGSVIGSSQPGTVSGCTYSGQMTVRVKATGVGSLFVGGIVGSTQRGTVSGCTFSGTIDAEDSSVEQGNLLVGGIAGMSLNSSLSGNDCSEGTPSKPVGNE